MSYKPPALRLAQPYWAYFSSKPTPLELSRLSRQLIFLPRIVDTSRSLFDIDLPLYHLNFLHGKLKRGAVTYGSRLFSALSLYHHSNMSFGYSVGDIITLIQLTTRTYNGWKNACGKYGDITSNLAVLQTLLIRIEAEAQAPNSLIARNTEDFGGWETLYKSCHTLVVELEEVLDKYKSLGTNRRKNWDRIRLGNRNLDGLNGRLVRKTASLSAYISVLGISSQARVENEVFPELLQKIDHMATQMRRGNSSIRSVLTTYEDDDKAIWREFRRELIGTGIRSREIHKYSAALKTYLSRLQRDGLLDEEAPLERDEEVPLKRGEDRLAHPYTPYPSLLSCG